MFSRGSLEIYTLQQQESRTGMLALFSPFSSQMCSTQIFDNLYFVFCIASFLKNLSHKNIWNPNHFYKGNISCFLPLCIFSFMRSEFHFKRSAKSEEIQHEFKFGHIHSSERKEPTSKGGTTGLGQCTRWSGSDPLI